LVCFNEIIDDNIAIIGTNVKYGKIKRYMLKLEESSPFSSELDGLLASSSKTLNYTIDEAPKIPTKN